MSLKRLMFVITLAFAFLPASLACSGYGSYVRRLLCRLSGTSAPIREKHWHYSHYGAGSISGRWTHPRSAPALRRGLPADVVIMPRKGSPSYSAEGRTGYRFRHRSRPRPAGSWGACWHIPSGYQHGGCLQTDPAPSEFHRHSKHPSAIYLKIRVFPQLGIAGALADKLSDAAAAEVASGRVEMVVLPVSEILPVPLCVDFVGHDPADLQFVQLFAAAVVKGKNPEASKRLTAFLASEKATPTVEKMGMQRPGLGVPK